MARPTRFTVKQWAAGKALAVQLAMVVLTMTASFAYALTDKRWLAVLAGACLLATLIAWGIAVWRIRAEVLERRQVRRSLE